MTICNFPPIVKKIISWTEISFSKPTWQYTSAYFRNISPIIKCTSIFLTHKNTNMLRQYDNHCCKKKLMIYPPQNIPTSSTNAHNDVYVMFIVLL